ncbi:MAG TPA: hypothetical protein VNW97_12815 [Candidatus Saccharimonadales bacterium]|jgi:hypothetical protein|nr:hypothetical protein [Candidatus Saccharimonadales bacterium]
MPEKKEPTEFEKFSEATKHLMSVPKKEIDRRHEEWAKEKEKRRKAKKISRSSRASGDR